jgi:hypothetical protein
MRFLRTLGALALAAIIAGCSSSSTGPDEIDETPLRTSPGGVLLQLKQAYEAMDYDQFMDCLADSFVFHLSESAINDDEWVPDSWGRAIEDTVHMRMFGEVEVAPQDSLYQVTLSMAVEDSVHSPGADTLSTDDDRWTIRVDACVRFWFPNDLQRLADCDQEFIIGIDPDEVGPDGEPLFEVLEWEDIDWWLRPAGDGAALLRERAPSDRAEAAVEECSWSHIKLFFASM